MPSATALSKRVGSGCQKSGSTRSSHFNGLSNLPGVPLSGTRTVYPSIECRPGNKPVPSEVRLVTVVEGKPTRNSDEFFMNWDRCGVSSGKFTNCLEPSPSTRRRHSRPPTALSISRTLLLASPSDAKMLGVRSESEPGTINLKPVWIEQKPRVLARSLRLRPNGRHVAEYLLR